MAVFILVILVSLRIVDSVGSRARSGMSALTADAEQKSILIDIFFKLGHGVGLACSSSLLISGRHYGDCEGRGRGRDERCGGLKDHRTEPSTRSVTVKSHSRDWT